MNFITHCSPRFSQLINRHGSVRRSPSWQERAELPWALRGAAPVPGAIGLCWDGDATCLGEENLRALQTLVGRLQSQQWVMREDSQMPKGPGPSSQTEKLSPDLSWGFRGIKTRLVPGGEARGHMAWLSSWSRGSYPAKTFFNPLCLHHGPRGCLTNHLHPNPFLYY